MPAFRCSGSTGQAPTTSFFGGVPDKFNMLCPGHCAENDPRNPIDSAFAANFVNQWTIYNPTVWGGANTASASFVTGQTAPDGTTTAAKMVESSLNDFHMVNAGWLGGAALLVILPRQEPYFAPPFLPRPQSEHDSPWPLEPMAIMRVVGIRT
jgi:hypothetical protein